MSRKRQEVVRTHCARSPDLIVLHEVDPVVGPHHDTMKPRGFWYEVDGDWRRWCRGEEFYLDRLNYLHAVELNGCNVLKIANVPAFDSFVRMFGTGRLGIHYQPAEIDWRRVAELYDGLEIAPYLWGRRLDGGLWYYGWDCASGVIWRPRNAAVRLLGVLEEATA